MALADLLKHAAPMGDDEAPGDAEPNYDESGRAAMKEFMAAVHSKDPDAAWEALKTCVSLCDHDEDDGESDDGGDDGSTHHALLLMPKK